MADNVELDAGSGGAEIAADDIGGIHYPRSKIVIGADGTNDGDVSAANPLPVTHAALTELAAAIDTEVQVDVVSSALPSGAASAANQTTIIGHVDGIETVLGTIDADTGNIATSVATVAGAVSGSEMQVDVLTMPTVTVDLGVNNDVTVTGSVTANAGTNLNTSALALEAGGNLAAAATSLATLDNIVAGNEAQVDIVAALPAGTNNIGDVDVASIAAGDNNIGNVDIVTMPAVTNAGTFAVQVDGAALTALQLIDNPVLVDDAAFTPATSSVMMAGFEADETATDSVDEGDAGAARMTLDRKLITTIQPHTAGGLSMSSVIGAANTNATVVKDSAGQVYEIVITNINAAVVYLKLYNKATTPDENDTPVWRMTVPGGATGAGIAKTFPNGLAFSTGIAYRLVTGVADNSTGAVSANEQLINVGYK